MDLATHSGMPAGVGLAIFWAFGLLTAIPMARIFSRAGFCWAWGLVCLLPYMGLFLAWVLLLARRWTWWEARS